MKDYKELIYKIRGAAARWEEEHPIVGVGQMRYCDALRDAAGAIEQLVKEHDNARRTLDQTLVRLNDETVRAERSRFLTLTNGQCSMGRAGNGE